jgi:hypothetical protein
VQLTSARHLGSITRAALGGNVAERADLAVVLRCPRCERAVLSPQRAGWICAGCNAGYPTIGEIPWLFAEPQSILAQWRSRLQFLLLSIDREVRALRAELGADVGALTRQRLEHLAAAYEDHAQRLAQLLMPLNLGATNAGYETHLALRTRLPSEQGLTNYYVNMHRDWVWGDIENASALAILRAVTREHVDWGSTLVLGAGSGRLAYDIHMQFEPRLTVAVDFNPLLLFVARDVTRGETVELYEFPIAPRRIADQAILRRLVAPQPVRDGFHIVAADVLHAPFAPEAFDVIVTPWLIDILGEDFEVLAGKINGLIRPGGVWINFGSLAFSQGSRAQRLSFEETVQTIKRAGFDDPLVSEQDVPYMRSPASRHGRVESIVAWCARKKGTVSIASAHAMPEWLVLSDHPVPQSEEFRVQAVATRIHAYLMALIDGRRSIQDMARLLVEQRLMNQEEAEPAVRRFLTRMYEDSRKSGL